MLQVFRKIKNNPYLCASLYYLAGNGIGQGIVFLSNGIFTRIMSQSDYGLYSNYYAFVSIFSGIIGLNLFMSLMTGFVDYREKYKEFRSSVLLLATICAVLVTLISLSVIATIGERDNLLYALFVAVHSFGFFVINYYVYSLNYLNIYKQKSLYLALPNVCQVAFSVMLILLLSDKSSFELRMIGSTFGIALFAVIAYIRMSRSSRLKPDREYWKYSFRISVPTILSSVSSLLMQQCDKIMITSFYGAAENAVYSFTYTVGFIPQAVMQATNGAWESWLFRRINGDRKAIVNAQKLYTMFMALVITGLFFVSPEVIKLMSPREYWHFEYMIPFLMSSGVMFLCSLHSSVFIYHKKMGIVSLFVCTAALINIALNRLLIPKYGGIAAAYTSFVSQVIMLICYIIYGNKKRINVLSIKVEIGFMILLALLSAVYYYLAEKLLLRYLFFGLLGIGIAVVLVREYQKEC